VSANTAKRSLTVPPGRQITVQMLYPVACAGGLLCMSPAGVATYGIAAASRAGSGARPYRCAGCLHYHGQAELDRATRLITANHCANALSRRLRWRAFVHVTRGVATYGIAAASRAGSGARPYRCYARALASSALASMAACSMHFSQLSPNWSLYFGLS